MYVNQIDELFETILNKFNFFLIQNKVFDKIKIDTNFVIYQLDILKYIDDFIKSFSKNEILDIIKNDNNYNIIINIVKKYCAFYIYLGIGYYYQGSRDLYITNMIETSRYQKDAIIQIPDFFNSIANSKIIIFYNDIQNLLSLFQLKTIDKIKIILQNNTVKYNSTINFFNELGEDYIIDYFLISDNFHNIIKTIIIKQLYFKEDKHNILSLINRIDNELNEYKYIDIVIANTQKIVDISIIQKFVILEQYKYGMVQEIYEYLEENKNKDIVEIKENDNFINYLFINKIIIPITEDLLRYHKDTERYDNDNSYDSKNRENTKIKYIINKVNLAINYYSPLVINNPKLLLETQQIFYLPLKSKMAILYNNNEEIKIIQKLENSHAASDLDILIDLYNIRKYPYLNFKNSLFNIFKLRPTETITSIRNINILNKNKLPLELRIANNSIDINIIGIAFNSNKKSLNCFNNLNLININSDKVEHNGFKLFIKKMFKTFNNKKYDNKLYYWIFNKDTDKPIGNTYTDFGTNINHNISIMLKEIYNYYIKLVTNNIFDNINKFNELNPWYLDKILTYYKIKFFNFDNNNILKNNIIENIYINKIKDYDIIHDDVEDYIPGRNNKNIIKLPTIDTSKYFQNIIKLREVTIEIDIDKINKNIPSCHHYIKWNNIGNISKKSDNYNQAIFNFVKQYVTVNDYNEYVCKSCGQGVELQKFVVDVDTLTMVEVNSKLEDIPKYSKFMKSIKNIDKNIEKFSYIVELISYLGNTPVVKLKRRTIIKDTIDLILLHSNWLRTQPKNRIMLYSKKYGISSELTNLFFFELNDEIFLTSSTDTDYYKIIKYNNIIAYMIIIIISELNAGQILNFKEDKRYNILFFNKIFNGLFNELYLRIGQKEKISFVKLPLLSYILYYFSGMLIAYRIWLYNDTNIDNAQKPSFTINLQKTIIHTIIDLFNTLFEANLEENKNYFYEVINTRLNIKINFTFNDLELYKRIEQKFNKNISYDPNTKKLQFKLIKIDFIELNIPFNILYNNYDKCDIISKEMNKKKYKKSNYTFNYLTNCDDGNFHSWMSKNNDLVCNKCNKSYNDLLNNNNNNIKIDSKSNKYLDKLNLINLRKLSKKYCITGEHHNIDSHGKCTKCNLIIDKINLTDTELNKLDKNLFNKDNEQIIINLNNIQSYHKKFIDDNNIKINNINEFNDLFKNKTNNNIKLYISNFITKLSNILGNKIKMKNEILYLNDTIYVIDHDYMGNPLKNNITILSSDNKIIISDNHPLFNFSILFYNDKTHNIYVYYDLVTLQYLGYSENNKILKKSKNIASLIVESSLYESLLYLGYENKYYNIYHLNKDYMKNIDYDINNNYENISNLIRTRIINLKQIISRMHSIIYNIQNHTNLNNINTNTEEKNILSEFINKIKTLNTNNIFIYKNIINQLYFNNNIPNIKLELSKNYINISNIIDIINTDTKLIFYLINNLSLLLDNNTDIAIQTELAYLIIKSIKYLFNFYYRPFSNYNIRKFDFLLINETPYIDEKFKIVGQYQELLTVDEINNPDNINALIDEQEANQALDIDDYDINDDIDDTMEALDNDIND